MRIPQVRKLQETDQRIPQFLSDEVFYGKVINFVKLQRPKVHRSLHESTVDC